MWKLYPHVVIYRERNLLQVSPPCACYLLKMKFYLSTFDFNEVTSSKRLYNPEMTRKPNDFGGKIHMYTFWKTP